MRDVRQDKELAKLCAAAGFGRPVTVYHSRRAELYTHQLVNDGSWVIISPPLWGRGWFALWLRNGYVEGYARATVLFLGANYAEARARLRRLASMPSAQLRRLSGAGAGAGGETGP